MIIITPPHNLKAEPVKNWKEIRKEAKELLDFLDKKDFAGKWKDAYAISHAQVSKEPKSFFVVHRDKAWMFQNNRVIINAKILSGENEVKNKEGCMGFPHEKVAKVRRFQNVKVEFYSPRGLFFKKLQKVTMDLEGLGAFIAQHEIDHAMGLTIHDRPYHKEKSSTQIQTNRVA